MINGFNHSYPLSMDHFSWINDSYGKPHLSHNNSNCLEKHSRIEKIKKFSLTRFILFCSAEVKSQWEKSFSRTRVVAYEEEISSELREFTGFIQLAISEKNPPLLEMENFSVTEFGIRELPDAFCELINLTDLNLLGNRLEALPEDFGNVSKLKKLDLTSNRFRFLPNSICELSELKNLHLGYNRLHSLPQNFGNLSKLEVLDLFNNHFLSFPNSVCELLELKTLNLGYNRLESLSEKIGELSKLEELNLCFNRIQSLPASIGYLSNLRRLDLRNNYLESVPESLFRLRSDCVIDLVENRFSSQTVEQLILRVQNSTYRGPQFYFCINDRLI
ncbi:hypothetical protein PNK_0321 [Candidatus Protochlamydia naegleriophila]|uniref:Disease resistance R13L4/SHOC-2-like LRR domain-containing protein n=1 Tax=Candidatus Protochlamydia naegleriophila TaxID=389348 RepID=A0A0U5JDW2_9BACT|nr:leucine-rich repeat domain-containing protein [Candidatus Protochlamydia naegleriophila]CUI15958.1 hypothetical protein PNK_0321 [Candidatus Protochlamydia naegleriophila]